VSDETEKPADMVPYRGRFVKNDPRINRNGQPKRISQVALELLQEGSTKATKKVLDMLDATYAVVVGSGQYAHVEHHPDCDLQFRAAQAILDRLYGRASVSVQVESVDYEAAELLDLSKLTKEEFEALKVLKAAQDRLKADK
jgi:hypothetical protein